jgi:hypothetical protein
MVKNKTNRQENGHAKGTKARKMRYTKPCVGGCGRTQRMKWGETWQCEECEREEWENCGGMCPWGWCKQDYDVHNELLCIPSDVAYGVSWAHTESREELENGMGGDIWIRNKNGEIIGLKNSKTRWRWNGKNYEKMEIRNENQIKGTTVEDDFWHTDEELRRLGVTVTSYPPVPKSGPKNGRWDKAMKNPSGKVQCNQCLKTWPMTSDRHWWHCPLGCNVEDPDDRSRTLVQTINHVLDLSRKQVTKLGIYLALSDKQIKSVLKTIP